MTRMLLATIFLFALVLGATVTPAGSVSVTAPWIREAPPNAGMLAAFMSITNNAEHTIILRAASSPVFGMIEIHQTKMTNGMAKMTRQDSLPIEPNKTVELKPGSYHLMLMKPQRVLRVGDIVKLQLLFDDGETTEVDAVVRRQ